MKGGKGEGRKEGSEGRNESKKKKTEEGKDSMNDGINEEGKRKAIKKDRNKLSVGERFDL